MKTLVVALVGLNLVSLWASSVIRRRYQEEIDRLIDENTILWEQVEIFNKAWIDDRARQAVKN